MIILPDKSINLNRYKTLEIEIFAKERKNFPVYDANEVDWKEKLEKANAKFPQAKYAAWMKTTEIEKLG